MVSFFVPGHSFVIAQNYLEKTFFDFLVCFDDFSRFSMLREPMLVAHLRVHVRLESRQRLLRSVRDRSGTRDASAMHH